MVGYLDGQVDLLCFHSKKTLFTSPPSNDGAGAVKRIFFTIKGNNALFGSFHAKEAVKKEDEK